MMNSKYLIDDDVLITLLKDASPGQLVWMTAIQQFQAPFFRHFKSHENWCGANGQTLLDQSFLVLINLLKDDHKVFCPKQTLFTNLIGIGYRLLEGSSSKSQMPIAAPYLAGEILVQLIRAKHTRCLYHLFSQYKEPTMSILNHKYGQYFNVSPQEIYGEAIMVLKNNIEQGKVQLPMKSRLFTYFFLIARNKYLALGNEMKGLTFYPDLMAFETKLNPADQEPYLNHEIENSCPRLKNLLNSSNKEFFKKLLNTFHIDEHELLRLRFEEGLRFREIGKILHLKEATCRKRLHDSIKKWKKQYFTGHVA